MTLQRIFDYISVMYCYLWSILKKEHNFITAGWTVHISWSKYCLCLDVNQSGTNHNCCTETCNLACSDLLMNPDRTPKTRSVWPTLWVRIACGKKFVNRHFKPAEPHTHGMLVNYLHLHTGTGFWNLVISIIVWYVIIYWIYVIQYWIEHSTSTIVLESFIVVVVLLGFL